MRLDAWEAQQAQYQQQQPVVRDGIWRDFIPGYDPDDDHWAELLNRPMYFEDLRTASRGWWRPQKGTDGPPPPEYRYTDGVMQLGRYIDAYGAQAKMHWAKGKWNRALIAGGIVLASSMVFGLIGGFLGLVLGGIVAMLVRRHYRRPTTGTSGFRPRYCGPANRSGPVRLEPVAAPAPGPLPPVAVADRRES
jgi:hypothetical protein